MPQGYRPGGETGRDGAKGEGRDREKAVRFALRLSRRRQASATDPTPRVHPMFRNRDRMVKVMVIVVSAAMVLALVLPFLALLGN